MSDRETGSVWAHLDGTATEGVLEGQRMAIVPMPQMTWGEWKELHPGTKVLSPDTPFASRYGPVRIGVLGRNESLFGDDRLNPNDLVVGVEIAGQFKGYAVEQFREEAGVVNDALGDQNIVVFYDDSSQTGLAYSRVVDGTSLEFYNAAAQGFELRDRETNSVWSYEGVAVSGPLSGESLEFVPSFISEWYGWSGYHPETALFQPG